MKNYDVSRQEISKAVEATESLIKAKVADEEKATELINLAKLVGESVAANLNNIPAQYKGRDDIGTGHYITLLACMTPTNDPQVSYIAKVLAQQSRA